MNCPSCNGNETRIYRTVKVVGKDLRWHRCLGCGCRFCTSASVDYVIDNGATTTVHICADNVAQSQQGA